MSNEVKVNDNKVKRLSFSSKEIETIRRTIAEKANDDEFRMFMHLAKSYGLDPFNGEIFFWKMNGKPTIMTSRDGYLKIADSHPSYDGLVSDVVRANDVFKRERDNINHEYGADRGEIIGAYALVYRKDRRLPRLCLCFL
ncbi:MAG: recombinase RecT [Candidatus Cloacimonetes bacterium]|nr:recombinase RecT [Candidatus Cloacimonadota bacterium]